MNLDLDNVQIPPLRLEGMLGVPRARAGSSSLRTAPAAGA